MEYYSVIKSMEYWTRRSRWKTKTSNKRNPDGHMPRYT